MLKSTTLSVENGSVGFDAERAKHVVETSLRAREQKQLIFAEVNTPPEKQFVELITRHAEEVGDERFALNALFLTTSLVLAQNTAHFFNRITDDGLLSEYSWIFQPEEVVRAAHEGVAVKEVCEEYFRPGGYSRNAIGQWVHNCSVMCDKYGGDMKRFMYENGDNAVSVVNSLVVRPRAKTYEKEGFRRFGPKLARLFVQWVNQYGLYDLENCDKIGLPVDFQLGRILIQTGALPLQEPTQAHTVTNKILLPALGQLCHDNGWESQEVSETLWMIGSNCCSYKRHCQCPVSGVCDRLISRTPYDRGGMFDPRDTGRYDSG